MTKTFPDSNHLTSTRKRGILDVTPSTVIVLAGDHGTALLDAKVLWGAVYEPEDGIPLFGGQPLFTILPGPVHEDDPIAQTRRHHDQVIQPALESGRAIFCVGAWWRDEAVLAATDGMPIAAFAAAWPTVTRLVTIDLHPSQDRPGTSETLSPDHVRITHPTTGQRLSAVGGALTSLGILGWPGHGRTSRKRSR